MAIRFAAYPRDRSRSFSSACASRTTDVSSCARFCTRPVANQSLASRSIVIPPRMAAVTAGTTTMATSRHRTRHLDGASADQGALISSATSRHASPVALPLLSHLTFASAA